MIFFVVSLAVEKSTLLGTGSVDSLLLWRVWAEYSFKKDCPQSFPGPPGRPGPQKNARKPGNPMEGAAAAAVALKYKTLLKASLA